MRLHRGDRNIHLIGNLLVQQAVIETGQNLALGGCQVRHAGKEFFPVGIGSIIRWREPLPAVQCRGERGGEVLHRHALGQVSGRAKRPGRAKCLRRVGRGNHDNRASRARRHQPSQSVEFLRIAEGEVQQDQVEALLFYLGKRLRQAAGVLRGRAIRKSRAKRCFERVTEQWMIVHDQDGRNQPHSICLPERRGFPDLQSASC